MPRQPGRTTVLGVVGVLALLAGGLLAYVTWRDTVGAGAEPAAAAPSVTTTRVVSRPGGFSVAVPTDMAVRKQGSTVRLTSAGRELVVTVGPGKPGGLPRANGRLLAELQSRYDTFEKLGVQRLDVGGRPALSAAGFLSNKAGVRLRFVAVTVRAKPQNYAIVAFAARDADPAAVLPRVNAVADGFEVLHR